MIELRQVSAGYGKTQVLRDVSFTAKPGEITTILGQNGCGKTTLLKAVTGALPLTGGEILLDGTSVASMKPGDLAKKAAYLSQGRNVPDITVGRLVLHGRFPYLRYPRRYSREDREIAGWAMENMGIAHLENRLLGELSGGMRQKAYIAMALAQQAPVILMDEPTTYLDIGQQRKFGELAADLAAGGKTVVLVLHDLLLALEISDQLAVLEEGKIVCRGTPAEILTSGILTEIYGVRIGCLEGKTYYYER